MMAGVQGSGKTTACAKLALHAQAEGQAAAAGRGRPRAARPRSSSCAPWAARSACRCGREGRDPVKLAKSAREGGRAPERRRGDHRHRRAPARRPRDDEAGPPDQGRHEAASRADGVRRHDRSGRRDAGARVHARGRHDRVHPHEARRRRARRRRAVDHGGHRHARSTSSGRGRSPRTSSRSTPTGWRGGSWAWATC